MDQMLYKHNLDETVERRLAFHNLEMKDKILFSVASMKEYPETDVPVPPEDELELLPDGTPIDRPTDILITSAQSDYEFSKRRFVNDDRIPMTEVLNDFGHAIVCEIMGYPIQRFTVAGHTGSMVPNKTKSLDRAMSLAYDENSEAVQNIMRYVETAVEKSRGKWMIAPYMMADAIHVIMLLFGYDEGYMLLYDEPDFVHQFCRKVNEINKKFFDMQYDLSGSVKGGWCISRSDWNPVRCISVNLDDYLACSNEVLQEFGLPYMQQMIDHFGCGLIHYHTPDTRLMKEVVKLKNIKIQVGSDLKLPEPIEFLTEIKEEMQDVPITWMRIKRDAFEKRLREGSLYGNVEYLVSGLRNTEDANALYEMSKEYICRL